MALLSGLLAAAVARPAHAKQPAPMSALAQRGEAALQAGELAAAEQALTAAYRQTPQADLLFLLGRLAAAQKQLLAAQDLMRRYLNDPTATPEPAWTAEAQKILAEPRPVSGKLRVQGDRGGLVSVDGRLLGRLPLVQPLLAAPGARTVTIQYPGKLLEVPVEVAAGRLIDIQCTRATGAVFLAVLPSLLLLPELTGLTPPMVEQVHDTLERAAQSEQLAVLKLETILTLDPELKDAPPPRAQAELRRCLAEPDCQQRLLHRNQIDHALKLSIRHGAQPAAAREPERAPGQAAPPAAGPTPAPAPGTWEFTIELLRTDVFGPARVQTLSCAPCTEGQALSALQEAVSKNLAAGLARPRGTLAVSSEPTGAEVWLGERQLGRTPLSVAAWADEYVLELRHPGHEPVRRTVRVAAEKTATVSAALRAIPPPPPPLVAAPAPPPPVRLRWERGPRPRWRLGVGGAAIFLGVALSSVGGLVLGISLNNNCPPPSPGMPDMPPPPGCDQESITTQNNRGIALLSVGGALTLAGIGLVAWPGPRRLVPEAPSSAEAGPGAGR